MTKKTPNPNELETLDRGTISRFITAIENREPKALKDLKNYFSAESLRRCICFTGPAGVGKSSLISELLPIAVEERSIAWVACDPSSPETGGSLLGDRIRSSGQNISERAFIRSMSTRGAEAFSLSIRDVEVYLENFFEQVWVETAGSGQTQSETARLSALTALVLQPETGDEIQWMKAGVREWADIFVINKSDLPGAELMKQSLMEFGASEDSIFLVSTKDKTGLEKLWKSLKIHLQKLDWPSRREILHTSLARSLFLEREMKKLKTKFNGLSAKLISQPYSA